MVIPLQFFVLNMAIALENHSNQDGGMSIQKKLWRCKNPGNMICTYIKYKYDFMPRTHIVGTFRDDIGGKMFIISTENTQTHYPFIWFISNPWLRWFQSFSKNKIYLTSTLLEIYVDPFSTVCVAKKNRYP